MPGNLEQLRIGFGTDLHRLAPGLPLVVGGVRVESSVGCIAHSDGDVVLHALIDALLGATGLGGDIGQWFPPSDPQWQGADSAQLLAHVVAELDRQLPGWQLNNVDITVDLERPKLLPYKAAMAARIADLLRVEPGRVSVKAKTAEGQNAVGQGLAIACQCVVLMILP